MAASREVLVAFLVGAIAGCGRVGFSERTGSSAGVDGAVGVDGLLVVDSAPSIITKIAVADGVVRDGLGPAKNGVPDNVLDGATVQALDVPNFEDRGVVEFALPPALTVTAARIDLVVSASMGPFPFPIEVFGYGASTSADGTLATTDWASGTSLGTFMYAGEPTVSFDVTGALVTHLGSSFVGFRFEFQTPSAINLNGPFVAFHSIESPPAAVLAITE